MTENNPVVFFDGECKFCNSSVNFIIKRDRNKVFRFAPLQGKAAQDMGLTNFENIPDSIILIKNQKTYKYSDAALKIARNLDGLWKMFYIFIIVPRPIRDVVYKFVAANRYKWFGKYDQCMVPDKSVRERFLE